MDWMYRGVSGLVDREEYLKGRRIDKTFEIIDKEENGVKGDFDAIDAQIPESLFAADGADRAHSSTVTVDLAAKMREDPLYEIRLKQREQTRKLLDNPIKMKRLKTLLERTIEEDKRESKGRNKAKRERRRRESSDESSSDDERDERRTRDKHKATDSVGHKSGDYRDKHRHSYGQSSGRRHDYNRKPYVRRDDSARHDGRPKETARRASKLSAEELERRRKEMMANAVWREESRKSNVKSYAEQESLETKFDESGKSAQFIKPLLSKVTDSHSLEDRIKQKRFTSQRSYNSMSTNFAKKA